MGAVNLALVRVPPRRGARGAEADPNSARRPEPVRAGPTTAARPRSGLWRGMFWIGALPIITLLPLAFFKMPEWPAWLASRGRTE